MASAVLIIEYELGEAQRALPLDAWRARATQIAEIGGLRWKYWLRGAAETDRGGVYLFDAAGDADRAGCVLVESLRDAGALNVRHRVWEVDGDLSAITRGEL